MLSAMSTMNATCLVSSSNGRIAMATLKSDRIESATMKSS